MLVELGRREFGLNFGKGGGGIGICEFRCTPMCGNVGMFDEFVENLRDITGLKFVDLKKLLLVNFQFVTLKN